MKRPSVTFTSWRPRSRIAITTSGGLATLKAEGLDPSKWLKNLSLSTSGGQDTISADLDLASVFADVAKFGNTAYDNPKADALTFRDNTGAPITSSVLAFAPRFAAP